MRVCKFDELNHIQLSSVYVVSTSTSTSEFSGPTPKEDLR